MLRLNTDRLIISPLNKYNLELAINNFNQMENNLNLTVTNENIGSREKYVYNLRLQGVKNNSKNYMWYTTWIIILKTENRFIGHIMLKGYPNENGEVTIGYWIQDKYKRKGYMFEALKAIIPWIFLNSNAKFVIADTLKNNIPSQKLLQKIGMIYADEDNECFWWKLSK